MTVSVLEDDPDDALWDEVEEEVGSFFAERALALKAVKGTAGAEGGASARYYAALGYSELEVSIVERVQLCLSLSIYLTLSHTR